ncbi:MAG: cytochrome b/b6 domain-containing protein [Gallionella sp.]|nr:cytochrome b/b6 domain-containing protein [Gallionella sp.]
MRDGDDSAMARVRIWDLPVRVGHWSLVAAFVIAWLSGDSERWRMVHVVAGFVMAGALVFRLFWGLAGSRYARFSSFMFSPSQAVAYLKDILHGGGRHWVGHNPAGSYAIYLLILLGFAVTLSGWAVYAEAGGEWLEDGHELIADAMLAVVGLHVVGAVVSSLAHRENLIRSMVSGYKQGKPEDAITGMRAAWLIVLFACMLAAGWLGYNS